MPSLDSPAPARPSRRLRHASLVLTTAGLLGACAGTGAVALHPLELVAEPEVRFEARVAGPDAAWAALAEDEPVHGALRAASFAAEPIQAAEGAPTGPFVELECAHFALDVDEVRALVGLPVGAAWAGVTDLAELSERLGELEAASGDLPRDTSRLVLEPDQRGSLVLVNQRAYIRDFTFASTGTSVVADPNVAVLADGLSLEVVAGEPSSAGVAVALDLASVDPQNVEPVSFELSAGAEISLQQPLVLAQRLRTHCTLRPQDALVLVSMGRANSSELLLTIVRARPYED